MIYSIGYATKPIDTFIEQLKRYEINIVCDVRSVPFSKRFFDYHQDAIKQHLQNAGIRYLYLGEQLGPRSKDPEHYVECDRGLQVQFDRLMESNLFIQGMKRLRRGQQKGFRIALMCAEKDPATCHRSLLIGYALKRIYALKVSNDLEPQQLQHINHLGELETQDDLESRLVPEDNLNSDLFADPSEQLKQAYEARLKATSYVKPT